MSLKERYIIPKRKESEQISNHHYHRHHHHSSKHSYEENNSRSNFSTRSSIIQQKPIERFNGRRSFVVRDIPRTQEQKLSKDERRKLFEQQYEDAEKVNFLFFLEKYFLLFFVLRPEQRQQLQQPMVKVQVRIFVYSYQFAVIFL
jgi:hypothetical protein